MDMKQFKQFLANTSGKKIVMNEGVINASEIRGRGEKIKKAAVAKSEWLFATKQYYLIRNGAGQFWPIMEVKTGSGNWADINIRDSNPFASQKAAERFIEKEIKEGNLKEDMEIVEAPKYPVYHTSYTSALNAVLDGVKKQGFEVDEDDWFNKVTTAYPGKPGVGKTTEISGIGLKKNGEPSRKGLHVQVYGMESGKYELNYYIS